MEILDKNEIKKLVKIGCTPIFDCSQQLKCWVLNKCNVILKCDGPFLHHLTEDLNTCGEGFFVKCPGFDRMGQLCEFQPAFDAAKWKEKINLEKIIKLEAKVQELELAFKKKS